MRWYRILLFIFLFPGLSLTGCSPNSGGQNNHFEEAETLLSNGDYEGARTFYEQFIQANPASPLLPLVNERLANINRELESLMGRPHRPAPIYIRPSEQGEALSDDRLIDNRETEAAPD